MTRRQPRWLEVLAAVVSGERADRNRCVRRAEYGCADLRYERSVSAARIAWPLRLEVLP